MTGLKEKNSNFVVLIVDETKFNLERFEDEFEIVEIISLSIDETTKEVLINGTLKLK